MDIARLVTVIQSQMKVNTGETKLNYDNYQNGSV